MKFVIQPYEKDEQIEGHIRSVSHGDNAEEVVIEVCNEDSISDVEVLLILSPQEIENIYKQFTTIF